MLGSDARELGRRVAAEVDALPIAERRKTVARRAIVAERLGDRPAAEAHLVRPGPTRSAASRAREGGVRRALRGLGWALVMTYLLGALAWVLLAQATLAGPIDHALLVAWGLALVAAVPVRGWFLSALGRAAIGGGALFKQTVLLGALRGDLDGARQSGVGEVVGRAMETEAFEALALNGATRLAVGGFEVVLGLVLAAPGAGGPGVVAIGLGTLLASGLLARSAMRMRTRWTRQRLGMTGDLIERMLGHRTRLAQQPPDEWHRGEDGALSDYVDRSGALDRLEGALTVLPHRVFVMLALVAVALSGNGDAGALGHALVGILLAGGGLDGVAAGVVAGSAALVARSISADTLAAARRPEVPPAVDFVPPAAPDRELPIVRASDMGFAHPGKPRPVLEGVDLAIRFGDRVLIEGPSGGGKSTLASLLAGLRRPTRGLLLLHGLDARTWGDRAWRQRVVSAPQFNDNHVLGGSFAFNALLGRGGEAHPEAIEEVAKLCDELGLGPVLQRMPSGLFQPLGETGWQLSHGEKSRLYLARALLQDADVVLLDESFGALDPANQALALETTLRHAKTLVVIAHP
ncbi:MAG: ABC transporter ATP-binding protein [Myxococcota bacterium]